MLAFYPLVDPCVMSAMMNAMPWGNPVWTCFWFFELCVEEHNCCLTALNHSQKRDRLGWTWWHLRVIPSFWRLRQKADAVKAILIYLVKLSQQEREQRAATGVPCPDPVPFHCLYPFCCFLGNWGWHPGPGIC